MSLKIELWNFPMEFFSFFPWFYCIFFFFFLYLQWGGPCWAGGVGRSWNAFGVGGRALTCDTRLERCAPSSIPQAYRTIARFRRHTVCFIGTTLIETPLFFFSLSPRCTSFTNFSGVLSGNLIKSDLAARVNKRALQCISMTQLVSLRSYKN